MALLPAPLIGDAFSRELARIGNRAVRALAVALLQRADPRHFTGPATSLGNTHPPDEFFSTLPDPSGCPCDPAAPFGGQVIHVWRVAHLGILIGRGMGLSPLECDYVLAGCLAHDLAKFTPGAATISHHHDGDVRALTAALADDPRFAHHYPPLIAICEAHNGPFGARPPATMAEHAVALADHLASRRGLGRFDPRHPANLGDLP